MSLNFLFFILLLTVVSWVLNFNFIFLKVMAETMPLELMGNSHANVTGYWHLSGRLVTGCKKVLATF
jgi:hypothetical protein